MAERSRGLTFSSWFTSVWWQTTWIVEQLNSNIYCSVCQHYWIWGYVLGMLGFFQSLTPLVHLCTKKCNILWRQAKSVWGQRSLDKVKGVDGSSWHCQEDQIPYEREERACHVMCAGARWVSCPSASWEQDLHRLQILDWTTPNSESDYP